MLHGCKLLQVYIKKQEIHVDIAKVVEGTLDASYHELERPLPRGKNKKVIGIMKYKLGAKIMTLSNELPD